MTAAETPAVGLPAPPAAAVTRRRRRRDEPTREELIRRHELALVLEAERHRAIALAARVI